LPRLESLEGEDVRVKIVIRHRFITNRERHSDGIERGTESGDDVVDELIFVEGGPGHSHDVGQGLHLVHVLRRREILLLQLLELASDVTNIGATLRTKHSVHDSPDRRGGLGAKELARDVGLHGAEEEAEDLLVRNPPASIRRVVHLHSSIPSPSLIFLEGTASNPSR
jgi:hypothetical protein